MANLAMRVLTRLWQDACLSTGRSRARNAMWPPEMAVIRLTNVGRLPAEELGAQLA